jgi:hypothetical protein
MALGTWKSDARKKLSLKADIRIPGTVRRGFYRRTHVHFVYTTSQYCRTRRGLHFKTLNPLTPELNPFAQRCLTRFFTGDFASWTAHFVKICVKNQQMQQLFIQFINYVWYLRHVSVLHCHPQGAFLVPSERCSIEEQSIEYCGWAGCGLCRKGAPHPSSQHAHPQYSIGCSSIEHLSEGSWNVPWGWQCNGETCRRYHTSLINWMNNCCIC